MPSSRYLTAAKWLKVLSDELQGSLLQRIKLALPPSGEHNHDEMRSMTTLRIKWVVRMMTLDRVEAEEVPAFDPVSVQSLTMWLEDLTNLKSKIKWHILYIKLKNLTWRINWMSQPCIKITSPESHRLTTADGAYHCPVGSIMAIFQLRQEL